VTGAPLYEVLVESEGGAPRCRLEEGYGARLQLEGDRVAVNFVSTLDGIVSFGRGGDDSRAVSGGLLADRLLMGMLRAVAGVVVVGAGTLRATRRHQWTAEAMVPDRAADLAELRAAAGRPPSPAPLLVVSGSGDLPMDADAVTRPATPLHVLTPGGLVGAHQLGESGPTRGGEPLIPASDILATARSLAGGGPVLCEGGPHLFGHLLDGAVPIDLFLTLAPQLAGRSPQAARLGLVEGVALPPFARRGVLRSLRRCGDHLLVRQHVDAAH
jgi:riboflavin biosynthesis pyrimidine reductase